IVSLPNLRIIDFAYGHTGSTHDATAWEETKLFKKHDTILGDDAWVWADSAYPIQTWVVAPYKKPERYEPKNEEFNEAVSRLRIRSEHAIGLFKGRFPSLKNLRLCIDSAVSHKIATLWCVACIGIHSFAMQREAEEKKDEGGYEFFERDPFLAQGLSDASDEEHEPVPYTAPATRSRGNPRLNAARAFREKLKAEYFHHHGSRHRNT
ncbi:hypothetical protein K435DRAFT_680433, partial [Dendrothele bispora CBS 962.96]